MFANTIIIPIINRISPITMAEILGGIAPINCGITINTPTIADSHPI